MRDVSVTIPSWDGTPREVTEVWTLRKGDRVASCHFWTHPKGGEARLTIDGEWHRGSVVVDGRTLLDVALDWKQQFEGERLAMTATPWYLNWDMWSALGTVAAVAVALGVVVAERVRAWWTRPIIEVTYQNEMPWRRWARAHGSLTHWDLYFRFAVRNKGLTTARNVRAQLVQMVTPDGLAHPYLDPFDLHWVGTPYERRDGGLNLIPGQTEFVDVFGIPTRQRSEPLDGFDLPTETVEFVFVLLPQDPTPRGLMTSMEFREQILQIVV